MPVRIERDDVPRLVDEGAQLVEALPRDDYDVIHLPGAINLPLKELDAKAVSRLDRARPVIVYCNDYL